MEIELILKIAGIGLLVSVISTVLAKSGKDEHAGFVTIGGIIAVMLLIVGELGELIETLRGIFGL